MGESLLFKVLVYGALAAAGCCLIALCAQALRAVVVSLFSIFYQPFLSMNRACTDWMRRFVAWLRTQVADESARPGDGPAYYFIGAILYTILSTIFVLCDFGMVALTAEAMGMDRAGFKLPVDTSTLTALALVTSALFWGSIILDLTGVTHIGPWRKISSTGGRRFLMALSVVMIILAVGLLVGMAYWRGDILAQLFTSEAHAATPEQFIPAAGTVEPGMEIGTESVEAEVIEDEGPVVNDVSRRVLIATLMGIAALTTISTVFSGWGVVALIKFILLLAACLTVLPLLGVGAFGSWLCTSLLNGIAAFVQAVIDLLVQLGNRILGLFGYKPAAVEPATAPAGPESVAQAQGDGGAQGQAAGPESQEDTGFNPFQRRQS